MVKLIFTKCSLICVTLTDDSNSCKKPTTRAKRKAVSSPEEDNDVFNNTVAPIRKKSKRAKSTPCFTPEKEVVSQTTKTPVRPKSSQKAKPKSGQKSTSKAKQSRAELEPTTPTTRKSLRSLRSTSALDDHVSVAEAEVTSQSRRRLSLRAVQSERKPAAKQTITEQTSPRGLRSAQKVALQTIQSTGKKSARALVPEPASGQLTEYLKEYS